MSASREKKQRQVTGSTEKVGQIQAEQAAYKKKARLYTIIGCVIVVLVAALLIWNSGIFQRNATAAVVNDTEVSAGELSYYYYGGSRYYYAMYGLIGNGTDDDDVVYNADKNMSYQDYFLEEALTAVTEEIALYNAALKAGYSEADIAEELETQIASIKQAATSNGYTYRSYIAGNYGRLMTPSIFEEILARQLLVNKFYNDHVTEVHDGLTADDLDAYYAENPDKVDTFTYSYLYFKADTVATKDEDGVEYTSDEIAKLKEEAMAKAKKKAEEILAQYQAGTDVATLIADGDATSSVDHVETTGIDQISSLFSEDLLKLNADEAAVVENEDTGYYVIIFHGRERNEFLTANVRHILFKATTTTKDNVVQAPTEDAWKEAKENAEKALETFNKGENPDGESFGILAAFLSADSGSTSTGGLYEEVCEGDFVAEFNDWLFHDGERKEGDTAVIKHEGETGNSNSYWGYHVTYFEGYGDETGWQVHARDLITDETVHEWNDGIVEGYEAELSNGAYTLGK